MINKTKRRIFDIIQIGQETDLVSRLFDYLIILVIIANIACMFLETFDELAPWYDLMRGIEYVTLLFFIFEYVLRIWTVLYEKRNQIASSVFIVMVFLCASSLGMYSAEHGGTAGRV